MSGTLFWLASYPKSGNTWFRAFLSNLESDSDQPVSINAINTGSIASSRAWLDEVLGFDTAALSFDEIDQLRPLVYQWSSDHAKKPFAVHKTHDAWTTVKSGGALHSLAATAGAVYLVRNPLDVAISYANHLSCTIDEAIARMADPQDAMCRSRRRLGSQVRQRTLGWSGHVLSWVDAPGLACHVVRYEDMLSDSQHVFTEAAIFLRRQIDPERIAKALRFSEFKELSRQETERSFRERPGGVARFFRQGRRGDWRNTLSTAQVASILKDHGEVMERFGYLDAAGQPV